MMKHRIHIITLILAVLSLGSCITIEDLRPEYPTEQPEKKPSSLKKVSVAEFIDAPESRDVWYELTGEIINIANDAYGNLDISDGTGEVYIYGLTNGWVGKNDKSFASIGLKVGDIVTMGALRSSYNDVPQGGGPAYYISHIPGDDSGENEDESSATDLTYYGQTANCYVVSSAGMYKFKTVKGNSSTSVGSVSSVEVLWESFGTSETPYVGDLVKNVSYSDGYIQFSTPSTFREGNAVIAAKNSSGTILWSWHIWLTDQPAEQVYANNAGIMMDRNLGATSATPGDVGALGLLYQWGRKDPFLGSSSISSSVEAKSTGSWPSTVTSSSSNGTIAYATKNPMTFITYNDSNYDWYYTGSSSTDNTRWASKKTVYDPCPAGWRVPDGGSDGVWAKAGFDDNHAYDDVDKGMLFGSPYCSPAAWYPASGYRGSSGSLYYAGNIGYYWSVTPSGSDAYGLGFANNGRVNPSYYNVSRAYGQSVRCLQE